ncbi:MAG: ABC transporter permease [Planctomycetaceae bacterium]|nr:ABC transporter permease [Planctomycetaceae bacterium]
MEKSSRNPSANRASSETELLVTSVTEPVKSWPIGVLVRTRLIEFSRRPAAVFWTYVFPLVMMFILGSAFRSQGESPSQVGILLGSQAEVLKQKLQSSPDLVVAVVDLEDGLRRLRAGRLAVLIRESARTNRGTETFPFELIYDPQRIGARTAELLVQRQLRISEGVPESYQFHRVPYSEPGGRYIDFLVPGLIGMVLLGGGLWGVGYAIVDMRIRKLLKRFLATPMRKSDFLLGIVFSRMMFVIPQIAVIMLASYLGFSVTNHGSWFEFALLVLLGGLQFAGVGLLIASRAKTMETMSGLINLAMLPMWTLSGIFFSYENFPELIQWPIRLLPLTPLLDTLRGVMLDGNSLTQHPIELALILSWTVGTFGLALWLFRWTDGQ